jgi:hypothetical protein
MVWKPAEGFSASFSTSSNWSVRRTNVFRVEPFQVLSSSLRAGYPKQTPPKAHCVRPFATIATQPPLPPFFRFTFFRPILTNLFLLQSPGHFTINLNLRE